MNDKQKNILIIILFIIIVALIGIMVWGLSGKEIEKPLTNNYKEEINIEEVSNNLFARITGLYMCGESKLDLGEDNKLTYEELDEGYINRMVVGSLFLNKKYEELEELKYSINVEDFKEEYKKLFGDKNYELPQTTYISYIKFDLEDDSYIGSQMAMGCEGAMGEYYLEKYEKEGDKVILYTTLLYSIGENQYLVDNNVNIPLEENIETYTKEEILKDYKSELITYKYTFNIEDDNYIFESIELAN